MKVTNISKAPQGIRPRNGRLVWLKPGQSLDLDLTDGELANARRRPGLFDIRAPLDPPPSADGSAVDNKVVVAEVIAMADDGTPFLTFKAEAAKLLGDAIPAKKAEILDALKAL